jgi:hypothetical protein
MTTVENNVVDVPQCMLRATGLTSASATFPVHAPLRSHQARAIAKECSLGTSARGTMVMCRSMV